MLWFLVAVVYLGALFWSLRQQKGVSEPRDIRLDFGSKVDEVEPALRLLASYAHWQGLCLNVYINASDDEARAIAFKLGSSMPLNLFLDHFPQQGELPATETVDLWLLSQPKSKDRTRR